MADGAMYSNRFAVLLFVHRICFILARAVMFMCVPFSILYVGGLAHESGITLVWGMYFVLGILIPMIPIIFLKFIWRIRCPVCGDKLDREVVGTGNYDCDSCDASFS